MEKAETERKEKLSLRFVPSRRGRENSKKIAKKFKKSNNTITASFQGEIGWKTLRKGENKNYCYVSFLPDVQEKITKKWQKKLKKLKETITDSSQAKIDGKMLRKRENKNYHSVSFIPEGEEKIPKK